MDFILKNITRLGLVSIYPIILLLCFGYLLHKKTYQRIIKENYKSIIINTLGFITIGTVGILIYFHFENTIYAYDYAGHWIRSLELRQLFFENPFGILEKVYESMNYHDYSYLPALFGLGLTIINTSYTYFVLVNFIYFLIPSCILLQLIYFKNFNSYKYLPLGLFISFYPLYYSLFFGSVDNIGFFFLIMIYILIILEDFKDIGKYDYLLVNLLAFLAIFLRRWYLYPVLGAYIGLLLKYLAHYHFKPMGQKALKDFIKILSSGIIALIIILLFFRPFFLNVIFNNFSEAYAFYDHDNKLIALINFYSPLILIPVVIGIYSYIHSHNSFDAIILILMIILGCGLFWMTQSFEYHHYYIISLPIFIFFMYGMVCLFDKVRYLPSIILCLCLIQPLCIYTLPFKTMPLFTNLRKSLEYMEYKDQVIDFANYLNSIMTEDWQTAYIASGNAVFNDSMIRNSLLPSLDFPNINFATLDIRDGFPKDFEYIQFIITIDPILYTNKEYQHIYEIISEAIWYHPEISQAYQLIKEFKIDEFNVQVYEKIGEITSEMKQYFYDRMLEYYPDKAEYFKYILD